MAFRSYSQRGSFREVRGPQETLQLQRQNQTEVERLQQQAEMERQRAAEFTQAMQEKLRAEQQNRNRNYDTELYFSRQIQKWTERNQKTEAQNIKAQTEQQVKNYEALADLSATAAELAVDKQAKKNQEEFDAIFWEEVANAGSLNEQSQLAEVEDEQLLEDGAINATANTVEEQTGSAIEAAQI